MPRTLPPGANTRPGIGIRLGQLVVLVSLVQAGLLAWAALPAGGHEPGDSATLDTGSQPPDPFASQQRLRQFARLGVDRWHAGGHRGQGVKIAILDSGFRGYRGQLGRALPARVTARSFRGDGDLEAKDSVHGILCGEVAHALAPEAELLLANWEPDRSDQFLDAVRWARQQGARVITCSVIMPTWSDGEGDGPIHQALSRLLGQAGDPGSALCFASAGNIAQRHWAGVFHANSLGWHEWAEDCTSNVLTPWGGERVSVEMYWRGGAEYQLAVFDLTTGEQAGESLSDNGEQRNAAVVRFLPVAEHSYVIRLRRVRGQPGAFHLAALGAGLGHATAQGSIAFPGDGPEVVAVGAVDGDGQRVSYSSCGPSAAAPKPDLVAAVPFPSLCRSRPFSGTSAAAPQAAALAALVWSRHPQWTAADVRETLRAAAEDLGPPGHDVETGFGLIRLPEPN
jgi:Subtilase family